jgi:hypothetical protein
MLRDYQVMLLLFFLAVTCYLHFVDDPVDELVNQI